MPSGVCQTSVSRSGLQLFLRPACASHRRSVWSSARAPSLELHDHLVDREAVAGGCALIFLTRALRSARRMFSIFIASTVASVWPSSHLVAFRHGDRHDEPGHRAQQQAARCPAAASPASAAPVRPRAGCARRRAGRRRASAAGSRSASRSMRTYIGLPVDRGAHQRLARAASRDIDGDGLVADMR